MGVLSWGFWSERTAEDFSRVKIFCWTCGFNMVAMLAVFVAVFVSLLHGGHCTLNGAFATSTVKCDPAGFEPTFTYEVPQGETQDVQIDIDIGGSNDAEAKCIGTKALATVDATDAKKPVVVTKAQFHADFAAMIPFERAGKASCGGALVKFTDSKDSKEKIKYEVLVDAIV